MTQTPSTRLDQLGRFLLRGLRIGASTVAIVELLRQDWPAGLSAAGAWVLFLVVERRLPPPAATEQAAQASSTTSTPEASDRGG
ncbi:MAG: hypothetical protein RLZZ468_519 [Cyanobacteriota bacterium]|jgi:hypothetical protein